MSSFLKPSSPHACESLTEHTSSDSDSSSKYDSGACLISSLGKSTRQASPNAVVTTSREKEESRQYDTVALFNIYRTS